MTLLLKVILSKPRMSKACQYNIRKMKENAFTLTRVELLPFWLNLDKNEAKLQKLGLYLSNKKNLQVYYFVVSLWYLKLRVTLANTFTTLIFLNREYDS